jgi:hypothetical protein
MASRGKVVEVTLSQTIIFNDERYSKALVEIDHVNYGLDPKTKFLSKTKRTNFSPADVGQFLLELDGTELVSRKVDEDFSYFAIELMCPVKGSEFGKKFRLIFTTSKSDEGVIGTITLYRVR